MKRSIAFAALSLFMFTTSALAIVNGVEADEAQHPEVGLIVLSEQKIKDSEMTRKSISDFLAVCSGAFVSDRMMVTAGHCFFDGTKPLYPYLARKTGSTYKLTAPLATQIAYTPEERDGVETDGECSVGEKPLPQTKTPDLGLILFPPRTSSAWLGVLPTYEPRLGDKISYYGFGSTIDPFANPGMAGFMTGKPKLRLGEAKVLRSTSQRIGFVVPQYMSFAADGDSGGPVLFEGKLIGILSTLSVHCETELGDDYGMLNTSSLISDPAAKAFIQKANSQFKSVMGDR